jgi:hypothetical protein
MNITRFTFGMFLAAFVWVVGCATPNPLAGWRPASANPDQAIENDYHDYIQKLPPKEKEFMGPSQYFEDGTGQHAVRIETDIDGKKRWFHILVYDKDNKRIKTTKYYSGRFQS